VRTGSALEVCGVGVARLDQRHAGLRHLGRHLGDPLELVGGRHGHLTGVDRVLRLGGQAQQPSPFAHVGGRLAEPLGERLLAQAGAGGRVRVRGRGRAGRSSAASV
jgi:hypothetical protein